MTTYKVTLLTPEGKKSFDCPSDMYILDAAEEAGIDLPHSCRAGSCSACVARVVDGFVDDSESSFLENHADEWVSTCCAYPLSPVVLKTHVEEELIGEMIMEETIREQKAQEEMRRQAAYSNVKHTVLGKFSENNVNGNLFDGLSIHNFTTRAEGYISQEKGVLTVGLNVDMADKDVLNKTYFGASFAEIVYNNREIGKSSFSIKENYLIDSRFKHLGTASFSLPSEVKGKEVTVKVRVQGIYNSGSGHSGVPRTIETKVQVQ